MGNTLYERQSVTINDDEGWIACLYVSEDGVRCLVEAQSRMLCEKHEKQARRGGWIWKYPGNYLDDYTGEGEDALDEVCHWLFAFDMDTVMSVAEGEDFNLVVKFAESGRFRGRFDGVGWGGYVVDELCAYCLKNKIVKRLLCETCYKHEREAGHLWRYPTNRYLGNVAGHAWWMLTYQRDRLEAIAGSYGVSFGVSSAQTT